VELELRSIDMQINPLKSSCIKIGSRFNADCICIQTADGIEISWKDSIRYLGIYLKSAQNFRCNWSEARRKFFISANTIFGKLGRTTSEEVHLQLIYSKCLPMLIYGTECCYLTKADLGSFDFVVMRYLMKLFQNSQASFIVQCLEHFGYNLPSSMVEQRTRNFKARFILKPNLLCALWPGIFS
jgi:hypothetical protein